MNDQDSPDGDAALVARCGDRGFTPGARDVPGLLRGWHLARAPTPDAGTSTAKGANKKPAKGAVKDAAKNAAKARKHAKQIVKALARGDRPVAAALLAGWKDTQGVERAIRVRAAAQISQRLNDASFHAVFAEALRDEDPQVTREGIRALGKIDAPLPGDEETRIVAVLEGGELPEQRAAADTLGRRGGPRSGTALRGVNTTDEDLGRRVAQAITLLERRSVREQPTELLLERALPRRAQMILRCRSGSAQLVARHAVAVLHKVRSPRNAPVEVAGPTELSLSWAGPLGELYGVRSVTEVALVFGLPDGGSLEDRIVNGLTGSDLENALRAWTEGPLRFRLAFTSGSSRAPLVWNIARRLAAQDAQLVNDSRDVPWTIEVDENRAGRMLCIPRNASVRFPYRVADVPAASHPTLAALMAWVACPVPGDVIWDPFCGSGTELVECARLQPDVTLIGTDNDSVALEAARKNVGAADLQRAATLRNADALDPAQPEGTGGLSLIITNPPMGHRARAEGDAAEFLDRFIARAATLLRPGGRLVWVTPDGPRAVAAAEAAGLRVHDHGPLDLGGLRANLQVMRRP